MDDLHDLVVEHLELGGASDIIISTLREELRSTKAGATSSRLCKVFQYAKGGTVEVNVVPIHGVVNSIQAIQATAATTVRDLKVIIEAQVAIPWAQQALIHENCVLQDDLCLAAYNITPIKSTITLHCSNVGSSHVASGGATYDFPAADLKASQVASNKASSPKGRFSEVFFNPPAQNTEVQDPAPPPQDNLVPADSEQPQQEVLVPQRQESQDETPLFSPEPMQEQEAGNETAPYSHGRDIDLTAVMDGNGDETFLMELETVGDKPSTAPAGMLIGHPGFGLKSLGQTEGKVVYDANRFEQSRGALKSHQDDIYEKINHMRQTLRGRFVAMVPLLSDDVLNAEERATLVGKLRPWNHPPGTVLVEEGAVGDELFIVEHGSCAVYRDVEGEQIRVKQLGPGEFFGELAVIYDVLRAATVVTESLATVLTLSRKDLFSVIRSKEQRHRLQVVARAGFLQDIPFFQSTKLPEKVTIAECLQERHWQAGESIVRQGDHSHGDTQRIYIIEEGLCVSERKDPQEEHLVCENLRPGQSFGMLGMLYGAPRGATVKAMSKACVTISISLDELRRAVTQETMSQIRLSARQELLRRVPLLRGVSGEDWNHLCGHMQEVRYAKWASIVKKGAPLDNLLVLEEGMCMETLIEEKTEDERHLTVSDLSPQQVAEMKEAFDSYDADSGGTIDLGELRNAMQSAGQCEVSDDELKKIVGVVDSSGDFEIDFPEFLQLMVAKINSDPKIQVTEHRTPGTWFCDQCASEQVQISPTLLVAITDVTMLQISREAVQAFAQDPEEVFLPPPPAHRGARKSLHSEAKIHRRNSQCDY